MANGPRIRRIAIRYHVAEMASFQETANEEAMRPARCTSARYNKAPMTLAITQFTATIRMKTRADWVSPNTRLKDWRNVWTLPMLMSTHVARTMSENEKTAITRS